LFFWVKPVLASKSNGGGLEEAQATATTNAGIFPFDRLRVRMTAVFMTVFLSIYQWPSEFVLVSSSRKLDRIGRASCIA